MYESADCDGFSAEKGNLTELASMGIPILPAQQDFSDQIAAGKPSSAEALYKV
ncbi:hypothetical protein DSM3645_23266 [Blastopirellula marina DSM 3645]|uniref:Uncharacterized protein n=1 Tax=Blastopirellula marina DSM 3645 TaxID=314230 RepID=A3ZQ90_9BACT|nr:hypothetical protein DSM3645_23266 [Blastopirellula marina DSM 3645]